MNQTEQLVSELGRRFGAQKAAAIKSGDSLSEYYISYVADVQKVLVESSGTRCKILYLLNFAESVADATDSQPNVSESLRTEAKVLRAWLDRLPADLDETSHAESPQEHPEAPSTERASPGAAPQKRSNNFRHPDGRSGHASTSASRASQAHRTTHCQAFHGFTLPKARKMPTQKYVSLQGPAMKHYMMNGGFRDLYAAVGTASQAHGSQAKVADVSHSPEKPAAPKSADTTPAQSSPKQSDKPEKQETKKKDEGKKQ